MNFNVWIIISGFSPVSVVGYPNGSMLLCKMNEPMEVLNTPSSSTQQLDFFFAITTRQYFHKLIVTLNIVNFPERFAILFLLLRSS